MRYCKRCLYPETHPLNLVFDDEGICSGCRVHEEKDELDWEARGRKLGDILNGYKSRTGRNYDCIIPVSGGSDSYFIVHTVKHKYGMNPLLVSYNKHYNTDLGIRNLANLRIKFDCDYMMLTVNPEKVKRITRATLRRMGSMYWHCIAGQTVYPVQMAVKLKIPLIIWGAHQGVDQVGMYSHLDEVEMTRKYRKEHDLMGFEAEDLVNMEFDGVGEQDLFQFNYPDDKELERIGVRGIYLNNYIRWDSKAQHEQMIAAYGYETHRQTRTFDNYHDVDSFYYSDLHDYIKQLKCGYGKVTDHACREIRLKRMTREQGWELVQQYIGRAPQHDQLFFDWLGITRESFDYVINQFRNPAFWYRNEDWKWASKNNIPDFAGIDAARLDSHYDANYILTPDGRPGYTDNKQVLVGKGAYNF